MRLTTTFAETRDAVRADTDRIAGLVPTLGYWHEGHVALAEAARRESDVVVASIFVNPLQFNQQADLEAYPRDVDRDAGIADAAGVDVLFVPDASEMFSEPPMTRVSIDALSGGPEGERRPGHFSGVATVVTKLLAGVQPDRAYFGRKDAQQLALVSRLVRDLSLPVEIQPVATVREFDGLALSSRNARLTSGGRAAAVSLSSGLMRAADAVDAGERSAAVLVEIAMEAMERAPGVRPEYAVVAGADDVQEIETVDRVSFLAVAATVGDVRLIDNLYLDFDEGRVAPDRGVWLQEPSAVYR